MSPRDKEDLLTLIVGAGVAAFAILVVAPFLHWSLFHIFNFLTGKDIAPW